MALHTVDQHLALSAFEQDFILCKGLGLDVYCPLCLFLVGSDLNSIGKS